MSLVTIIIIHPNKILYHSTPWVTTEVLYQNNQKKNRYVERQMQDIGALGVNRRTVEVRYVTDWFMFVSPVEVDLEGHPDWIEVDM